MPKIVSHPFFELRDFNSYQIRLLMPLELVESCFLLDELAKNEGEQFLVVPSLCEVLSEALSTNSQLPACSKSQHTHPFERLLDSKFLCTDKAANSDRNCHVNVVGTNIFSETHLGASLCHPNHAL